MYKVFDSDDFGCNHVISPITQSHDCRDILTSLHMANPNFKATLFTIPGEVTVEMLSWAAANRDWIELAWHGFYHRDNYECAEMSYEEFEAKMNGFQQLFGNFFVQGFKAPGWQIGDEVRRWLKDNGYWLADHVDNGQKRLEFPMKTYKVGENSVHTHTWDCVGNGVYELADSLLEQVKETKDWKFVSEVLDA